MEKHVWSNYVHFCWWKNNYAISLVSFFLRFVTEALVFHNKPKFQTNVHLNHYLIGNKISLSEILSPLLSDLETDL